jgi:hypothetical protein
MINSTYAPKRFDDLNADCCMVNNMGVSITVTAGSTGTLDLLLSDDHLITGLELMAMNSNFGDLVTLQVVDTNNMLLNAYGSAYVTANYPQYPVLRQFATNCVVNSDTQVKLIKEKTYPAKVNAGLTIRCLYTSKGSSDVNLAINYELHKLLV